MISMRPIMANSSIIRASWYLYRSVPSAQCPPCSGMTVELSRIAWVKNRFISGPYFFRFLSVTLK
ncbi:hypothetical protein ALP11_200156 [Pseudomonas syringae pv. papulans]|nr:hypothetical protein ALP11_200156 [Pseudomonas syringae pv. papulans]